MALNMAKAQLARLKAAIEAKTQLRLGFDTVLQVKLIFSHLS